MRINLPTICALAATALLMSACDSESSDPSEFSSGVGPTKTVEGLTDAEAQLFCDAMQSSFGNLISQRKTCELFSVSFTEDSASCRAFADQCAQMPPETPEPSDDGECSIADAEKRMDCAVTIETLEGCMGAVRGLTVSTLDKISCSDAGDPEGLEAKFANLPMGVDQVPGCETVAEACPQLFAEDEQMGFAMPTMDPPADQ